MEHIKEFREYVLNEADGKKKIKKYKKVKVGDMAMENPDAGGNWDGEHGKIVWKGTAEELRKSKYSSFEQEWEDEGSEIDGYDLIVVDIPKHGEVLFNYNNDPSGAVVYKK